MKHEWEQVYQMYQLDPAPPKLPFQEYIRLYCTEKDEKYFLWFLHYYEKTLNAKIKGFVQRYAMYGHFEDMKQTYVMGLMFALEKYDIRLGIDFLYYVEKEHEENVIHTYIRTMRTGLTVHTDSAYTTLRAAMLKFNELGQKTDDASIAIIAAEIKRTPKTTRRILEAGLRNMQFVEFYRQHSNDGEDDEEEGREEIAQDNSDPAWLWYRIDRANKVMDAFEKLDYLERLIVSEHLGFCMECYSTKTAKNSRIKKRPLADIAVDCCLTPGSVERIYQNALKKMRAELKNL